MNRRAFIAALFAPLLLRLLPKPAQPECWITIISGPNAGRSYRVVWPTPTMVTIEPCF